jgi:hypothetical protein
MSITAMGKSWFVRKKVPSDLAVDWRQYQHERIQQERARIHHAHGELGILLLDILARHDPLRIVSDANPAEYEPMLCTMLPRLQSARCVEEAQRIVREEVVHWLGDAKAGAASIYVKPGQEIWEATKRHQPA